VAHEAVIGLECHLQLRTRSKMFCGCAVAHGAAPNSVVCPVCLGLPGALPRANRAAVEAGLRLGLALGCDVPERSVFARKNYLYPDMPKGYQVTQYDRPLCTGGALPVTGERGVTDVAIARLHLEEDTGKSMHPARGSGRAVSRLDFNRAGVPLAELVTEPVLREPAECAAFITELRRLVRWLGVSDADMEKGQLRCDANVSLRPGPSAPLGVRTELKNLNSIRGVERGLAAEIARQRALLASGGVVEPATLLYDVEHDRLAVMRAKEGAEDYRYFPEPDLPPLGVGAAWREAARAALPELPWARAGRLAETHGLAAHDADVLCGQRELADYFEACAAVAGAAPAAHWVARDVLAALRERDWPLERFAAQVPPGRLADLAARVADRRLPGPLGRRVFGWMLDEAGEVDELLSRHGARARTTEAELEPLVRAVLAENARAVEQVRAGRARAFEFLVGRALAGSGGEADPETLRALLRAALGTDGP
jgi:aspartyl-tRNA(Asn)/glutamyl-tRNA(Gln) amidotransferase subunit B